MDRRRILVHRFSVPRKKPIPANPTGREPLPVVKKQIVKMPKLHFFDSGLLCYLLGIREPEQLRHHPLRGAIFESWMVSERYKSKIHAADWSSMKVVESRLPREWIARVATHELIRHDDLQTEAVRNMMVFPLSEMRSAPPAEDLSRFLMSAFHEFCLKAAASKFAGWFYGA